MIKLKQKHSITLNADFNTELFDTNDEDSVTSDEALQSFCEQSSPSPVRISLKKGIS
jgi:hypothetical protein